MSDDDLLERIEARRLAGIKPGPEPLPAPTQRWRPATDAELAACKPAATMLKKALALGWQVQADSAIGPYMGSDGTSLGEARAVSLIFRWRRFPDAHATWYDRGKKTPKGATVWECEAGLLAPIAKVTGTALGHWLAGTAPKEAAA